MIIIVITTIKAFIYNLKVITDSDYIFSLFLEFLYCEEKRREIDKSGIDVRVIETTLLT